MMQSEARCYFCGQFVSEPRKTGVIILGQVMCPTCEARVVNLQVQDVDYDYYKGKIGTLWSENSTL